MSIRIKIFAFTVPALLIVLSFALVMNGISTNNNQMISSGYVLFVVAIAIQFLSILRRR